MTVADDRHHVELGPPSGAGGEALVRGGRNNFDLKEIDLHVAQEAASIRTTFNLTPPDALVVATAVIAQVGHLVTNDERRKKKLGALSSRIKVAYLEDYVPL